MYQILHRLHTHPARQCNGANICRGWSIYRDTYISEDRDIGIKGGDGRGGIVESGYSDNTYFTRTQSNESEMDGRCPYCGANTSLLRSESRNSLVTIVS